MTNRNVLIIVGPTAVGKTALSLELAQQLHGEIISADSRQVYKYMDIGTAKPTIGERQKVRHHFIDIIHPDENYSAGKYGKQARAVIDTLLSNNIFPIVVGGSGFYIKALVDGFFENEISNHKIKAELIRQAKDNGLDHLYQKLKTIDPELADRLHPNDSQRIIRGIEVWEETGLPLSYFQKQQEITADFNPIFVGLTMERSLLYQRINQRVDQMIDQGLVAEVAHLKAMGYSDDLFSLQTVGYTEVFGYFRGEHNYDEMIELIKQKSRNYSKRQFTWFNKDKRIHWFQLVDGEAVVFRIEKLLNKFRE